MYQTGSKKVTDSIYSYIFNKEDSKAINILKKAFKDPYKSEIIYLCFIYTFQLGDENKEFIVSYVSWQKQLQLSKYKIVKYLEELQEENLLNRRVQKAKPIGSEKYKHYRQSETVYKVNWEELETRLSVVYNS